MKIAEIRERSETELQELERELRERLVRLSVAKATQRLTNTAQFSQVRRDIARIKTVQNERVLGIADNASEAPATEEANS